MSKQYKHSICGIAYRGLTKKYDPNKPVRLKNESDENYGDRIALTNWARPTVDDIENNRDKIVGLPIWNRHIKEDGVFGEVKGVVLDYNKDGTADVRVNVDLSDKGIELLKKYNGGLSLAYNIEHDNDGKKVYKFEELSLTPSPRIEGSIVTSVKNEKYDICKEIIRVKSSLKNINFENINSENNMSENNPQQTEEKKEEHKDEIQKIEPNDDLLKEIGRQTFLKRAREVEDIKEEFKKQKFFDEGFDEEQKKEKNKEVLSFISKNFEGAKGMMDSFKERDELKSKTSKYEEEIKKIIEENQKIREEQKKYQEEIELLKKKVPDFTKSFQTSTTTVKNEQSSEKKLNDFISDIFEKGFTTYTSQSKYDELTGGKFKKN